MVLIRFITFLVVIFIPHMQCVAKSNVISSPIDLQEYFPNVKKDMTQVTWTHACNSKERLENELKSDVMMIEADIIAGHFIGSDGDLPIPMMGHPPATTGDLSLEQLLDMVLQQRTGKGIKLDFKSIPIFKASEVVLQTFLTRPEVDFPVWVNADILKGPGDTPGKEVVDAHYFLQTCVNKFPTATISVGWTVDSTSAETLKYSSAHITEMTSLLAENNVVHPVTFPVHSGIASNSIDTLTSLLHSTKNSLTLWAGANEWVDYSKLHKLIEVIGKDKVFVDMPQNMKEQLMKAPLE